MTKKNFHSVPFKGDWAAKKEGTKGPLSVHRTQANAESRVRTLAKQEKTEAVYHYRDGRIKDKDSFGRDPMPPKDKKP